jgi:transcription initiation factor TFIIIB Brf1 subunit/transcription initiation factor TFIIB
MLEKRMSSLFDEFDTIMPTGEPLIVSVEEPCAHLEFIQQKNIIFCLHCGKNMQRIYNQEKDWKHSQTRAVSDEKNIFKDIINLNLSTDIFTKTNCLYMLATSPFIYRGKARKGIISACIFYAYMSIHKPQIFSKITDILRIERKDGLKGLKFVSSTIPRKIQELDTPDTRPFSDLFHVQVEPTIFIDEYMYNLKARDADVEEVRILYRQLVELATTKLDRNRPQSVASGLIYYWILKSGKKITLKYFAKSIALSELTITKIEKVIRGLLDV